MNFTTVQSDTLKVFNISRINEELLNTPPFLKALQLIETIIGNPHLSVKFSQTCIASLRNEQLYDLIESRRHIPEIYSHLIAVLQNININLSNFDDKWSSFTLGHKKKSSFDTIMFDRATIKGATQIYDDDVESVARHTYFFFAKLLHEIAHASMAELGRKLPTGDDDARFSSPTTHAMTGEVGDVIERHFFGSVIDGIGRYVNTDKTIYKIDYVILRERRNRQIITNCYFRQFLHLNLMIIESIPLPHTDNLPPSFRSVKRRRRSESPSSKYLAKDLSMTKNSMIGRMPSVYRWGWGPEANEDSDDDDQDPKLVFDSDGNPRPRNILWKE